jgi:hypothetical protein
MEIFMTFYIAEPTHERTPQKTMIFVMVNEKLRPPYQLSLTKPEDFRRNIRQSKSIRPYGAKSFSPHKISHLSFLFGGEKNSDFRKFISTSTRKQKHANTETC